MCDSHLISPSWHSLFSISLFGTVLKGRILGLNTLFDRAGPLPLKQPFLCTMCMVLELTPNPAGHWTIGWSIDYDINAGGEAAQTSCFSKGLSDPFPCSTGCTPGSSVLGLSREIARDGLVAKRRNVAIGGRRYSAWKPKNEKKWKTFLSFFPEFMGPILVCTLSFPSLCWYAGALHVGAVHICIFFWCLNVVGLRPCERPFWRTVHNVSNNRSRSTIQGAQALDAILESVFVLFPLDTSLFYLLHLIA